MPTTTVLLQPQSAQLLDEQNKLFSPLQTTRSLLKKKNPSKGSKKSDGLGINAGLHTRMQQSES